MDQKAQSDLWDDFRKGNSAALETIYRLHAHSLLTYGYKICRDQLQAEDNLQELFFYLWQHRKGLGKTDSVRRYLFSSYRRSLLKELLNKKKVKTTDEFDRINIPDMAESANFISPEQRAKLKSQIELLSTKQKEIIYLKYFQGMDYEEIGAIMGLTYQSVRNTVSRALKSLREHYKIQK
jgi:RNA polymerase sigma-70 factor (ECF subfamily)